MNGRDWKRHFEKNPGCNFKNCSFIEIKPSAFSILAFLKPVYYLAGKIKAMFLFSKRKNKLLRENKELKEAISPLTNLGIPIGEIKNLLVPFANLLKAEIEKELLNKSSEVSYRSHGGSASSSIGVRR